MIAQMPVTMESLEKFRGIYLLNEMPISCDYVPLMPIAHRAIRERLCRMRLVRAVVALLCALFRVWRSMRHCFHLIHNRT